MFVELHSLVLIKSSCCAVMTLTWLQLDPFDWLCCQVQFLKHKVNLTLSGLRQLFVFASGIDIGWILTVHITLMEEPNQDCSNHWCQFTALP